MRAFSVLSAFSIVAALACALPAADPAPKNVTPAAIDKILRRGDRIQELGTIKATAASIAAAALDTVPPNDDQKFHITVITSTDPAFAPACNSLLAHINTNDKIRAWIKRDKPAESWCHYQVVGFEDKLQQHWIDGVRPLLFPKDDQGRTLPLKDPEGKIVPALPAIIIQPPANGQFGENDRVVTMINGYNGDAEALCERIQNAVDSWIQGYSAGHIAAGKPRETPPGPGRPPFEAPDAAIDQFEPTNMRQLPSRLEPAKRPLTPKQIKELLPNAPKEFRSDLAEQELTDPNEVKAAWLAHREKQLAEAEAKMQEAAATPPPAPPVQPPPAGPAEPPYAEPAEQTTPAEAKSDPVNPHQSGPGPSGLDPISITLLIILIVVASIPALGTLNMLPKPGSRKNEPTPGLPNTPKPNSTTENTPCGNVSG